jgi:hypothetical protein
MPDGTGVKVLHVGTKVPKLQQPVTEQIGCHDTDGLAFRGGNPFSEPGREPSSKVLFPGQFFCVFRT